MYDPEKKLSCCSKLTGTKQFSWGQDWAPKKEADRTAKNRTAHTKFNTFSDFTQCKHYLASSVGGYDNTTRSTAYILKKQELTFAIYKPS